MADMKKWWIEEFFFWLEPIGDRKWSQKDFFWMPVENPGLAKWARGPALIYGAYAAVLWSIHFILKISTPGEFRFWALMYTAIWGLITWGLLKMRREAALAGSALFVWSLIAELIEHQFYESLKSVVVLWWFVQAMRGTFAYQRLAKLELGSASGR
jgi:hypothetical protein